MSSDVDLKELLKGTGVEPEEFRRLLRGSDTVQSRESNRSAQRNAEAGRGIRAQTPELGGGGHKSIGEDGGGDREATPSSRSKQQALADLIIPIVKTGAYKR